MKTRAPMGSLLRLKVHQSKVVIEVAPPEKEKKCVPTEVTPNESILSRAKELLERVKTLQKHSVPLADRKSELLAQSAEPGFWNDPHSSQQLLDEVYRLDGILGEWAWSIRSSSPRGRSPSIYSRTIRTDRLRNTNRP